MLDRVMSPSIRSMGRSPAVTCRSDAPRSIISSSSTRRLSACGGAEDPAGVAVVAVIYWPVTECLAVRYVTIGGPAIIGDEGGAVKQKSPPYYDDLDRLPS